MAMIFANGFDCAQAQETRNAIYYCAFHAAGGVSYSDASKAWEGTRFKPGGNIIIRMSFVKNGTLKAGPFDFEGGYYEVTVKNEGDNVALPCSATYGERGPEVFVTKQVPIVSCTANISEYELNIRNNRIVTFYKAGYLNGTDNNLDTPFVSVGRCTKISE